MRPEPAERDSREARLDAVVAAYIEAQEAGESPDPKDWLARHADLAPERETSIEAGERMIAKAISHEARLPLLTHVDELRMRLIVSVATWVGMSFDSRSVSNPVLPGAACL